MFQVHTTFGLCLDADQLISFSITSNTILELHCMILLVQISFCHAYCGVLYPVFSQSLINFAFNKVVLYLKISIALWDSYIETIKITGYLGNL